jgi:nucleoside-diphosphate-sugar epimerase
MKKKTAGRQSGPVILITGGSGFLGAALVRELLKSGHGRFGPASEIRIFDIKQQIHAIDKRVRYIKGDVRSLADLTSACRNVDVVFHAASIIDWGQQPRSLLHEVNVEGTNKVIAAARAEGVEALVYTSTMDVLYAGKPIINGDESAPLPERYAMAYAETKSIAEKAALAANGSPHDPRGKGKAGILKTCAIRPCGMFGEGDPYHVSSLLRMAQKGRLLYRIGDGKALFQHVYVGNVAHAHVLAAKSLLEPNGIAAGKVYFITDFEAKNFFDYLEPIITGIGYSMPPKQKNIPAPLLYAIAGMIEWASKITRPLFRFQPTINRTSITMVSRDLTFSGKRARAELGYRPCYREEEAIARTIEYFKTHGPV